MFGPVAQRIEQSRPKRTVVSSILARAAYVFRQKKTGSLMLTNTNFVILIRSLGYLIFFIGLLAFFFILGPLVRAEFDYRMNKFRGVKKIVPKVVTSASLQSGAEEVSFGTLSGLENAIIPLSTEYGIVIEKINANAKVIANVNPAKEKDYTKALTKGVAEALGSTPPGEAGNLYLFSHSTNAPWNIVRFNAVFYLLRELEIDDRVIIFYKNKRFDYEVFDKHIVSPTDVSYLTNRYNKPVLTLQTCDPPGTLINRLIVRAKLAGS